MLWQLPEVLRFDEERMTTFFQQLPRTVEEVALLAARHDDKLGRGPHADDPTSRGDRPVRHVLEFRHRSFCEPEALDLLRRHGIGCVVADTAGRWPQARGRDQRRGLRAAAR